MRFFAAIILLAAAAVPTAAATVPLVVYQAHQAVIAGDLNAARFVVERYRSAVGVRPEYLEALSWLGRGELAAKDYPAAEQNAAEVRKLLLNLLGNRNLDSNPSLPEALGASIEVQAQSAAAQGRRAEAVAFLRGEVARWRATSIRARIQKNLNLLTLEGKPAPALATARWLAAQKAQSLAAYRGRPVLLFFWAHWCSDCKQEIAIVQKLQQTYGPRGLAVIAPTQHYGYVANGQDAPPEAETKYIASIWRQYYASLGAVDVPLSEENFANYGVSTTPTLVLIDARGIVRLYNPGALTYEQLAAKIEPLVHATAISALR